MKYIQKIYKRKQNNNLRKKRQKTANYSRELNKKDTSFT